MLLVWKSPLQGIIVNNMVLIRQQYKCDGGGEEAMEFECMCSACVMLCIAVP